MESYLCPVCQQKCQSVHDLVLHLTREHEDQATASGLKEIPFIDKIIDACKTIIPFKSSEPPEEHVNPENQEEGYFVDHIEQFRRAREVHLSEEKLKTNKLIKCIDKLYCLLKDRTPRTAIQKKRVEKNVVRWKRDKEDMKCGGCGKAYRAWRRRHHCRLCGEIRCKECCKFMTLVKTYPLLCHYFQYDQLTSSSQQRKLTYEVRMCTTCEMLVDRRLLYLEGRGTVLVRLYDKMRLIMSETQHLKFDFLKMTKALWSGECSLSLREASALRQELQNQYQAVVSASKRILNEGATDSSPRAKQIMAQNISACVSHYMQEQHLPFLPTPAQLREIKKSNEVGDPQRSEEEEEQQQHRRQQQLITPTVICGRFSARFYYVPCNK